MPSGLVIGAQGLLGRALLEELRAAGWTAAGTTRRAHGEKDLISFDLTDRPDRLTRDAGLEKLLAHEPLSVFLLAAATGYERCEKDPIGTRIVNVDRTVELAGQFVQRGAFAVFPSSSAAVRPATEYGRQKAAAEKQIAELTPGAPANAGAAIVRIAKVVSASGRFGEWLGSLANGTPIEAARDLMLSPVSSWYVAGALRQIAQRRESGLYQLTCAQDVSYFEFARMLAIASDSDPLLVRGVDVRAPLGGRVADGGVLEMGEASRRAGLEPQALESAVTDLIMEFREGR